MKNKNTVLPETIVTPAQRLASLREETMIVINNLRDELADYLTEAADAFEILKKEGITSEILKDEKFAKFRTSFASVMIPAAPVIPPTSEKPTVKGELSANILKAVSKGAKTQKEIEAAIGKEKIYMKLKSMVQKNLLARVEDGGSVKYKAA